MTELDTSNSTKAKRRSPGVWNAVILPRAAEIVRSYTTRVTLRQLFYRLVAAALLRNSLPEYNQLSARTAELRREGEFSPLMDAGRGIVEPESFTSPAEARTYLRGIYRRDRTEGQETLVYLGVEKRGLVAQLYEWFGDPFGLPIIPTAGYHSESLEAEILTHSHRDSRPTVLLYAGDLDPEGEDIERNLRRYTDFDEFKRVSLTVKQVEKYKLPQQPGKANSSRAAGFAEKYGKLFQVEVDALDPDDLRKLFAAEIARYWDEDAYQAVLAREAEERDRL